VHVGGNMRGTRKTSTRILSFVLSLIMVASTFMTDYTIARASEAVEETVTSETSSSDDVSETSDDTSEVEESSEAEESETTEGEGTEATEDEAEGEDTEATEDEAEGEDTEATESDVEGEDTEATEDEEVVEGEEELTEEELLEGEIVEILEEKIKISFKASEGGSVSMSEQELGEDDEVEAVTATADEGYEFVNWTKDGEEVSTSEEFTPAKEEATYVANFEEVEEEIIVINFEASEGGSVSDDEQTLGEEDEVEAVTATADEGYEFVNWTKDGEEVSTSEEFTPAKEEATYVANFEEKYPAIDFGSYTVGRMKVAISAPAGAFPKGTSVTVKGVASSAVKDVVENALAENEEIKDIKAVDITFTDVNGEEIQPLKDISVVFSNADLDGEEFAVYHIDDDKTVEKITELDSADGGAIETDSFSIYVVVGTETVNISELLGKTYTMYVGQKIKVYSDSATNGTFSVGKDANTYIVYKSVAKTKVDNKEYPTLEITAEKAGEVEITYSWESESGWKKTKNSETITIIIKDKYTVTFDKNGGNITGTVPTTMTVNEGENIPFPDCDGTKDNKVFVGWSKCSTVNTKSGDYDYSKKPNNRIYTSVDTYNVTEDTTFYAIWAEQNVDAAFFIRTNGSIPFEPQTTESYTGYSRAIRLSGGKKALKVASFYANQSGVDARLLNTPDAAVIQKAVKSFNPDTHEVVWYVIKYDSTYKGYVNQFGESEWHVDGVIVPKTNVKLTYDGQGADSGVPSGNTYTKGTTVTIAGAPEKAGYEFRNWNTKQDGTGTAYVPGTKITLSENTTLYAQWDAKGTTYYVDRYVVSGTSVTLIDRSERTGLTGTPVAVTGADKEITGYTYLDTYKDKKESGTVIPGNSPLVLKLYFSANKYTNTLNYNANGGSGAPSAQTASVTYPNTSSSFTVSKTEPTRTGYTFDGWYTAAEGGTKVGTTYTVGTANKAENQSATIYAHWTVNKYTNTLNYNANGGTGAPAAQTASVTYPNTSSSFTVSKTEPTRTGYTFDGWYTAAEGGTKVGTTYTVGTTNKAENQSATIYAHWTVNKYTNTLNYNANGGTGAPEAQTASVTYPNTSSSFTVSKTVPTRTGYTFDGWYTAAEGGTKVGTTYTVGTTNKAENQSATIYAHWTANGYTNTLNYDANGGDGAPEAQTASVTYPNTSSSFTVSKTVPTRTGYTFAGWYTADGAQVGITYTVGSANKASDQSATLYAHWTANGYTNTLNYDANGGDGAPEAQTASVTYPNTSSSFTVSKTVPTRTGYTFAGWYTADGAQVGTTYTVGNTNTAANQSATIYAHWTANGYTNTLNYDANGGDGAPAAQTASVTYPNTSSSFTVSATVPTRTGYTFAGWYTAAEGGTKVGTTYTVGTTNKAENQSATIYAHWTVNKYTNTLNYNANGGTGAPEAQTASVTYPNTSSSFTVSKTVPTRTGYTFAGWYTADGAQVGTTYTVGNTNTAANQSATIYAHWTVKTYTLTVNPSKGAWEGSTAEQSMELEYLAKREITNPVRAGYEFNGWALTGEGSKLTDPLLGTSEFIMGYEDATLTANWEAKSDTKYVVEHHLQTIPKPTDDKKLYVRQEKQDFYGTTDTVVTPEVKNYTGFTSPTKQTVTIAADGSTVVKYYYDRKTYTVTLDRNDGIASVSGDGEYYYGQEVEVSAVVKEGYTWEGWNTETKQSYKFDMPAYNVEDTAVATINTYKVYVEANPTGAVDDYERQEIEVIYGTQLNTVSINDFALSDNYYFTGWTYDGVTDIGLSKVLGNKTMPAKDITIVANFAEKTVIEAVANGKYIYDGMPKEAVITYSDKPNGLEITGLSVENATRTNVGSQKTKIIGEAIISDTNGNYVTEKYIVKLKEGELIVNKREVTLKALTKSAKYGTDAIPLTSDYEVLAGLASNQKVDSVMYQQQEMVLYGEAEASISLKTPGKVTYKPANAKITDADGNDVTENYDINYEEGKLEVVASKIPLTIVPYGFEKVYDGQLHSVVDEIVEENGKAYYVTGNLVNGDELYVVIKSSKTEVRDVVDAETSVQEYKVMNGEVDVTECYVIDATATALVKVTPRPIEITVNSGTKPYDGKELFAPIGENGKAYKITKGSLADNQEIVAATVTGSVLYPGEVVESSIEEGSIRIREINNMDGLLAVIADNISSLIEGDLQSNYDITVISGKLEITMPNPVALTITANGNSKVYDGTPLTATVGTDGKEYTVSGELYPNHVLEATVSGTRTNAGGENAKESKIDSYTIMCGNDDVSRFYAVTTVDSDLTVSQRPIMVVANDATKAVYDGVPFATTDMLDENGVGFKVLPIEGDAASGLLEGHTVSAEISVDENLTVSKEKATHVANAVVVESDVMLLSEESSPENYAITYVDGNAVVNAENKLDVTLTANSGTYTYTGGEFAVDGYTVTGPEGFDVTGLTFDNVTAGAKATTVGSYAVSFAYTDADGNELTEADVTITDAYGNNVTEYFTINYVNGNLVINARPSSGGGGGSSSGGGRSSADVGRVLGARREDIATAGEEGQVLGAVRAPKTSDSSRAILWMLVMGTSALGAAAILAQKKNEEEN